MMYVYTDVGDFNFSPGIVEGLSGRYYEVVTAG